MDKHGYTYDESTLSDRQLTHADGPLRLPLLQEVLLYLECLVSKYRGSLSRALDHGEVGRVTRDAMLCEPSPRAQLQWRQDVNGGQPCLRRAGGDALSVPQCLCLGDRKSVARGMLKRRSIQGFAPSAVSHSSQPCALHQLITVPDPVPLSLPTLHYSGYIMKTNTSTAC